MRVRKNEKLLPAVQPNVGIGVEYKRRLLRLVEEMTASYEHWLRAAYRANPPKMAQDALPARQLERALRDMGVRWSERFEEVAPRLSRFFQRSASRQSEAALRRILRDSGITVRFVLTPEIRDIAQASVIENVSLIKSIQSEYHTQVEGLVMRSVTAGRDLEGLVRDLRSRYDITEKRAKLIALQQNNATTSAIQRARQTSLGIEEGIWMHSHAGREPRKTHLANDGRRFKIAEGWFDPDPKVRRRIWPGELIHCRCTWRPIVKGFS